MPKGWTPATETNATEMFQTSRSAGFWFYGSVGDRARVYADEEQGIAVECLPEDRAAVIEVLSELLNLMKEAR